MLVGTDYEAVTELSPLTGLRIVGIAEADATRFAAPDLRRLMSLTLLEGGMAPRRRAALQRRRRVRVRAPGTGLVLRKDVATAMIELHSLVGGQNPCRHFGLAVPVARQEG
jgi:hypothetical protein